MSQAKIYVGNLSYDATSDDLENFFAKFGEITDVKLIIDRETNRSKGFGFITFATQDSAQAAIENTNGFDFMGRKLRVNSANDKGGSGGGQRRQYQGQNQY